MSDDYRFTAEPDAPFLTADGDEVRPEGNATNFYLELPAEWEAGSVVIPAFSIPPAAAVIAEQLKDDPEIVEVTEGRIFINGGDSENATD